MAEQAGTIEALGGLKTEVLGAAGDLKKGFVNTTTAIGNTAPVQSLINSKAGQTTLSAAQTAGSKVVQGFKAVNGPEEVKYAKSVAQAAPAAVIRGATSAIKWGRGHALLTAIGAIATALTFWKVSSVHRHTVAEQDARQAAAAIKAARLQNFENGMATPNETRFQEMVAGKRGPVRGRAQPAAQQPQPYLAADRQ